MKNIQWLQCSKLGTTKSLKAWINIEISTINSMIIYLITMWRWYNWLFGCKHDELKSSIEKFTCNHSTFSRASPDQGRGESIGSRLYNHTRFVQCLVPNPPSTNPFLRSIPNIFINKISHQPRQLQNPNQILKFLSICIFSLPPITGRFSPHSNENFWVPWNILEIFREDPSMALTIIMSSLDLVVIHYKIFLVFDQKCSI